MAAITAEIVDTGEKRDTRGRRVTPAERRAEVVRDYLQSGLTMAQYARRERITYATFAGWVWKEQRRSQNAPIKFAEMRLPLPPPSGAERRLEVRLADGTTLRGDSPADLAALIRALRS